MDNQQRVIRRRRNLPAEVKVEIVDCLPVENAAHFLANVPSRLIIHHCAPRIRRILKMIDKIAADYARTLPAANSYGCIWLENGHHYTPQLDIFLRFGAAHCRNFGIYLPTNNRDGGFVGYPVNFFNDLIKHYYETKVPAKAVPYVEIELPLTNPAPWPAALVQAQTGEMDLEEWKVKNNKNLTRYNLCNKHNPRIVFTLNIHFEGGAKCYEQMTRFVVW